MSFLNFVVEKNFISVICDGQLTYNNDEIFSNNYQKFYVHKNNFIVGATGQYQIGKELLDFCKENNNLTVSSVERKINEITDKYYLQRDENGNLVSFFLAIAYFTENDSKLKCNLIRGANQPQKNIFASPASITSDPSDIKFSGNDIVLKNIKVINGLVNRKSVLDAQEKAIIVVEENSNLVNDKIFKHLLFR